MHSPCVFPAARVLAYHFNIMLLLKSAVASHISCRIHSACQARPCAWQAVCSGGVNKCIQGSPRAHTGDSSAWRQSFDICKLYTLRRPSRENANNTVHTGWGDDVMIYSVEQSLKSCSTCSSHRWLMSIPVKHPSLCLARLYQQHHDMWHRHTWWHTRTLLMSPVVSGLWHCDWRYKLIRMKE